MVLDIVLVGIFAAVAAAGAAAVLSQRELFKAAIGLAFVFIAVSGFVLLMGQPLLALFQLFILVGGLSTYLIVAVASEARTQFNHVDWRMFVGVFVVLAIVLTYAVSVNTPHVLGSGGETSQELISSISNYYALMAAVAFAVFAIGIGSILLIKRVVALVV
ncbi:MAG: hypothetical protein KGH78_02155 [Candidatus Micrarchaeota archaeon]|nr:hypothetical protein [Candidatus Micrarchaeota archaeon]